MLNFSLFIYFDFLEGILEIRTRYFLCAKFSFKFTFSDLPKFYCVSTAQKMKFSITDFFSKCNQIRRKLQIWSHLLKKPVMENFIFCVVSVLSRLSLISIILLLINIIITFRCNQNQRKLPHMLMKEINKTLF